MEAKQERNRSETEAKSKRNGSETEANINVNINENIINENVKENENVNIKRFAEFVYMYQSEYDDLVNKHGKEFADKCVEKLDNYKGSSGKKYENDYKAILSWVVGTVKKESKTEKDQNFDLNKWASKDE